MRGTCGRLLFGVLATLATPAFADSLHVNRYEMVASREGRDTAHLDRHTDKIFVLDRRTGDLWSWSETSDVFMYRGTIFPLADTGVVARIIKVNSEDVAP
jgi:hypothetical protein